MKSNLLIAAVLFAGLSLGGCQMFGGKKGKCCGTDGKCCKKEVKKECCGTDGKCCKKAEGHSHDHDHGDHKHS